MNRPLVSIITPTYNREKYICEAITSVLNQTYDNYEMIIIDDGSTDNTKEIIKPHLADNRIKYIYQTNRGQNIARNTGLNIASGKYICFLDSDNIFMENKLEQQVIKMESSREIDILYSDEEYINEDGEMLTIVNMKRYSGVIYKQLLIDNCVSMNTTITRRECFDESGGFNQHIQVADDYELWLRFSIKYKFHYEPLFLVKYRIMDNQLSSDKTRRFESNRKTIRDFMNNNMEIMTKSQQQYIWCRFYARRGRHHASQKNVVLALLDYITACKHKILCKHPWRGMIALILFWRYL